MEITSPLWSSGFPVPRQRHTPRLRENLPFQRFCGFTHGRVMGAHQKAARSPVFAPLFDFVEWHQSCELLRQTAGSARTIEEPMSEGRKRIVRIVVAALGLMALLALQPESARLVESAWARSAGGAAHAAVARRLILSDQARRFLALQYRSYPTEFMGCMIGDHVVWINRNMVETQLSLAADTVGQGFAPVTR